MLHRDPSAALRKSLEDPPILCKDESVKVNWLYYLSYSNPEDIFTLRFSVTNMQHTYESFHSISYCFIVSQSQMCSRHMYDSLHRNSGSFMETGSRNSTSEV